ncbi:unnamed protein product [Phytomonas sp. Hart1]|nr:unnamed protein product [Phytomonas sp. Hart1]|eukprot:CCW67452.1 unnamed protein product [Phytomonas sp. isolate Hart1]
MSMYKREDLRRVIFSGLSEQCDEGIIHELCVEFGPVMNITWPTVRTMNGMAQRQSYCFVDFKCPEDAKYCYEALDLSQIKLFNKEIKVSHASTMLTKGETGGRKWTYGLHEVGALVVVRNVDTSALEFDITTFFEQFGHFAAPPRMMRDAVGSFRGTVILSYKTFEASDKVIAEMNQRIFRDRIINVQYAEMSDGSRRLHGTPEERANAELIRAEEQKYLKKLSQDTAEVRKKAYQARAQNTTWADDINIYAHR